LRVAAGEPLGYTQADISRRGAAIECRIYAEDPAKNFLPSPGLVEYLSAAEGPGIRHDAGVCAGYRMGFEYDAMIAKLCAWAPTRAQAVERMRRALDEYDVRGLTTNLDFQRRLLRVPDFVQGQYDTGFIELHREVLLAAEGTTPLGSDPALATAVLLGTLLGQESPGARQAGASLETPQASSGASAWATASRRERLGY
ncbi:MAG: acetyl-CoA carboxylase biotin carboxylase subunit, partial [Deltaproteobacteria bacterium]